MEGSEGAEGHYETSTVTVNAAPKHNFNAHLGEDFPPRTFHQMVDFYMNTVKKLVCK